MVSGVKSKQPLRVGVLFGGRSGEHEVSLNSARNVMDALRQAGHAVTPIGITAEGRWLTAGDPYGRLTGATEVAGRLADANGAHGSGKEVRQEGAHPEGAHLESPDGEAASAWALLPTGGREPLPAIDIVFPVLHGTYGEDGTVQGLLEMANLPYVGCGVLASAAAMDKALAKQLFAQAGLPQMPYQVLLRNVWEQDREAALDRLEAAMELPVFVKPANLGSSVGISKARDRAELAAALDLAARYDRKLVVEEAVPNAREIEVSVLGNDAPEASVPGEIVPGAEFYNYAAKYLSDNSRLLIPAPLSPALAGKVREMAVAAFQAVDGSGLARVDFLLDDESEALYLNEVNTMPGFTRISMYPKLWEASGVSYPELVDRLLMLALERHADRQRNCTSYEV